MAVGSGDGYLMPWIGPPAAVCGGSWRVVRWTLLRRLRADWESRVRESAAVFQRMGSLVTTRIFPGMGHLLNEEEALFASEVLAG